MFSYLGVLCALCGGFFFAPLRENLFSNLRPHTYQVDIRLVHAARLVAVRLLA